MRMHGVVVLHPAIDESEGCGSVWDRADPDVVTLEGFDEGLGHAVAFRAFDRREARHQVEGHGDVDRLVGGEDRTVVRQPLHWVRHADLAEPLLDAAHHHVADHLARDAGGCRYPTDDLAIVTIEGKGDADDLAVPAGELQCVGAPADVGADRCDLAVMLAWPSTTGVAFEHEAMFLHQPVDTLGVDRGQTVGSPLALEERGDPPVAVCRALIDQPSDIGSQLAVARPVLRAAFRPSTVTALDQVGPRNAERLGYCLHRISPGSGERDSNIGFFARARSSASLSSSTSIVLRPSSRSSSRRRSSRWRTSEAATTSSSARTASLPPWLINRLQRNTRLGESPC